MRIGEERGRQQTDRNQEKVARLPEIVQSANWGIDKGKNWKAKQQIVPRLE
jgi:hypothetical protein